MKNKDKKVNISFSSLTNKKWFLLLLSFLIASCIWVYISVVESPIIEKTITGVNVNIDTSVADQQNLTIFGNKDYTCDVKVSGKKYVVNSLTSDDISVTTNTNYVNGAGSKTLQLKITPANDNDDYTIVSSSISYIELYFDTYKEKEMPLKAVIDSPLSNYVPDGCIVGNIVLSQSTVTISGPSSEINRIESIEASCKIEDTIENTLTVNPDIEMITSDDTKLEYSKIKDLKDELTMTIPVLKIVSLPATIDFINAPAYFVNHPLSFNITPSNIRVAIPVENISSTKSIVIDSIDFNELINGNNYFTIKATDIENYLIQDETARFSININASSLKSKYISLPTSSIEIQNSQTDFNIELSSSKNINVRVVGTDEEISNISLDNIKAVVSTKDVTLSPSIKSLPITITVDNDKCWIYGNYEVPVSVVDNT